MAKEGTGIFQADDVERIRTGVPGLDSLLEGGFPHPSTVLVTGESGSGKTIFGLQYIYNGIQEYNEPGVYLRVQGYGTDLEWSSSKFGLNLGKLQEEEKLIITSYEVPKFEQFQASSVQRNIVKKLSRIIESVGAKRVVIDSVSPFGYLSSSIAKYRTLLYEVSRELKELDCTTILISEKPDSDKLTHFNVEPYVSDGLIELKKGAEERRRRRSMSIHKMVATRSPLQEISFNLSDDGFKLLPSYYK